MVFAALVAAVALSPAACLPILDLGPGGDGPPGPVGPVSVSGPVAELGWVADQSGPVSKVVRDCGYSTPVGADWDLWVFCDTIVAGQMVSNTAALARRSAPNTTLDFTETPPGASAARVTEFLPPSADEVASARERFGLSARAVNWMEGMVTDTSASPAKVVVFFHRLVVDADGGYHPSGVGVATWDVRLPDAAHPAGSFPIAAVRVATDMFDADHQWGNGAFVAADGMIYSYRCVAQGPCFSGRVAPVSVAVRASWEFWDGTRFQPSESAAVAVVMLPSVAGPLTVRRWMDENTAAVAAFLEARGLSGMDRDHPDWAALGRPDLAGRSSSEVLVSDAFGMDPDQPAGNGGVSVRWVPSLGRWVMSHQSLRSGMLRGVVRVAARPQGPWSDPTLVPLPRCDDSHGCYQVTVHPQASDASGVALSYVVTGEVAGYGPWGGMRLVRVPFTAS